MQFSRRFSLAVLLITVLSGTSRGLAADAQPILDVVARFAEALEKADGAALRDLIWLSEESNAKKMGRDAWVALAVAQKKLELAAVARFGGDGERFRCGFDLFFPPLDRQPLTSANVSSDGNRSARISREGDVWPIRLRRSVQGEWQIVIDLIELDMEDEGYDRNAKPEPTSQLRIDRLNSLIGAFTQATRRIEQGEFDTAAAADADLAPRVAAINKEYQRRLDALPDRYRWQQGPF